MEYIIPTHQQIAQLLPIGTGITQISKDIASSSTTTHSVISKSSEARLGTTTISSHGPVTPGVSKPQHYRHPSCQNTDFPAVSFPSSGFGFVPRQLFENPYTEYAYLTTTFQQCAGRATALVRQYVEASTNLQTRRKLRKRLNCLKSGINEAVNQEKAIFNRLAELSIEIQTRETYTLNCVQGQSSPDGSIPTTPSAYSAMSPVCWEVVSPTTPLDARSPEFIPFDCSQGGCQALPQGNAMYYEVTLEIVSEEPEVALPHKPARGFECPIDDDMETEEADDDWADAVRVAQAKRVRRLSLPCFQDSWP
ncbi:hypothetical protein BGZ63DRAFT_425726 [Mariannaea sp. PMI_226]|nr:hypothetical protein BGZ63DRAFT_425726 [Mariannaea sp. PMI_226]